jgi:hypothetical protein
VKPKELDRWCSPPLIVTKKEEGTFLMTVNVQAVNTQTEIMICRMRILEVVLRRLQGAKVFLSLISLRAIGNLGWTAWLDNVLGYEDSDEMFLCQLTATLIICEERGLKLNPA